MDAGGDFIQINAGDVLSNPIIFVPDGSDIYLAPGDTGYAQLHGLAIGDTISFCQWNPDGAPGMKHILVCIP